MKIGKTIASSREKAVSESERFEIRRKQEKKKRFSIAAFFMFLVLAIVLVAGMIVNFANERKKDDLPEFLGKTYTPTVEIIDEDGTGYVTEKIKTAVGMLEEDFKEYNQKISKVIVPSGMAREIDVYLDGVEPYFKIHVDRNTAESAEDANRMIEHLKKKNIKAQYVDIRIAERAYYK
jgi:cell division septal protein FtsQ